MLPVCDHSCLPACLLASHPTAHHCSEWQHCCDPHTHNPYSLNPLCLPVWYPQIFGVDVFMAVYLSRSVLPTYGLITTAGTSFPVGLGLGFGLGLGLGLGLGFGREVWEMGVALSEYAGGVLTPDGWRLWGYAPENEKCSASCLHFALACEATHRTIIQRSAAQSSTRCRKTHPLTFHVRCAATGH
jgi:hypothetical protein